MSVDIEPSELSFQRPFTIEVARTLTLKNPNSTPVAFKVKTTAPKQYCVRPNAGRIEPGQSFDVSVLLQAMKTDPAPDAKCRDKFLVQSAPITSDKEFASIATVLDVTDKSTIQERKIRVTWLSADSNEHQAASATTPSKNSGANGVADTPEASRTYSSPKGHANSTPSSAPPPYDDEARDESEAPDSFSHAVSNAASNAATTVANTYTDLKGQIPYDELKAQLAKAEAQLASLKDSSGLRQRNVKGSGASDGKTVGEVAQAVKHTVEGVPVQLVAVLCLISFLLAYFFF